MGKIPSGHAQWEVLVLLEAGCDGMMKLQNKISRK